MEVLKTGSVARFDSFGGLIPCKVLAITGTTGPCSSEQRVKFRITRKTGPYQVGEIMESFALHVVPPKALHRRRFSTTIARYTVECDKES